MTSNDEERGDQGAPRPGDAAGLGRVVKTDAAAARGDGRVEEASEDSFPASDPPGYVPERSTPSDREEIELPDPGDVP